MLLTRELNLNRLSDTSIALDLLSVSERDYFKDENKVEVLVEHNTDVSLYEGQTISVTNVIERNNPIHGTDDVEISESYDIIACDNISKSFSIISDKYQNLLLTGILVKIDSNIMYLYFSFNGWHYFRSWETHGIDFFIEYLDRKIYFTNCEYVNDTELRWRYDGDLDGIDDLMCYTFKNDTYKCVGYADEDAEGLENFLVVDAIPKKACFTDELYLRRRVEFRKNCVKWELYEKECNDGSVFGLQTYRLNFRFKNINLVSIYITIPLCCVNFPLSLTTGNDTYLEQNLYEGFTEKQIEKNKNGIIEMEKLAYHPVCKIYDGSDFVYKPIRKIKFNLHFRKRNKDGWVVDKEGLWNGMDEHGLLGDVTNVNGFKFFSYIGDTVDKGRQSDLLCYLGFTDSDVKQEKEKISKSFLRLSFYDKPNSANQRLLAYSTIYMNSNKIFSKMLMGSNFDDLYVISGSESNLKYSMIKVNTEPCFVNHTSLSIEEIENFRLSSQIVICDNTLGSQSEGFYLYLWADENKGYVPSDIYMKVDFNHAGFGRIIPMTMPYSYDNNSNHIYTMSEIYDLWNKNNSSNYGWGIRVNEKFSYIHFKYCYDPISMKHVYYLDTDTYGNSICNDDTIELNFYEPKIVGG